jgi:hypothetical protein
MSDDQPVKTAKMPDTLPIGVPLPLAADSHDEIRPWPVPSLLGDVDRAVKALPAGAAVAVIGYANKEQAGFAVVARKGEHWSFMGKLDKPWDGRWEYGAAVVWTP